MSETSLEERVKKLEEINEMQQKEIQHLKDVHEIENMTNRYEFLCHSGKFEEVVAMFAQKTPGVRAELGPWGVYEGIEGIKKLYIGVHNWLMRDDKLSKLKAGLMLMNLNTTPVIEVARDGKTAKGTWICPGLSTKPLEEGKFYSGWSWVKRAYDFVKEDGKWKFWHYHVYGVMMCPFDQSWTQAKDHPSDNMPNLLPDELKADGPTTYHWLYSTEASIEFVPVPPLPYETFDEKTAY